MYMKRSLISRIAILLMTGFFLLILLLANVLAQEPTVVPATMPSGSTAPAAPAPPAPPSPPSVRDTLLATDYLIELGKFGIKNDGTAPQETSAGLNQALQYAKSKGFSKIILPEGTYLIDESNPIVIDLKNTVIDLNGSTLQINTNGLEKYSVVVIKDGAENVRLTNGIIRGDKDTHDYSTIKGPHEWGCGISFLSGKNLQMDNVTVTNVTGYGIYTDNGISDNRFYTLYTKDVTQGNISDDGSIVADPTKTRTMYPYDISVCGGQFELGYTLGYEGYPYLLNRQYTAYFYSQDMNFIQKTECLQYRKADIPAGAKYVHFVFPQASIVSDEEVYAWISNFKPPTHVKVTGCLIKGNRSLGLGFCGGQQWVIENNIFESNGGNAPSHAVDFEDGWELMQDIVFRNNKFISNDNDLVVSAGDNLVFEGNEFEKGATFWERTTNYTVKGNKFNGGAATYRIKKEGCQITDNQYIKSSISAESFSSLAISFTNESLIDSNISVAAGTKLINSTISAAGFPFMKNATMENCTIEMVSAQAVDLTFKNCTINNTHLNLYSEDYFKNCQITNSTFSTQTNTTKVQFKDSEFVNSQMLYNTWAAAAETTIEGCKAVMNTNLPLVSLAAGKTHNLAFKNNVVTNQAAAPVIELSDTTSTLPNGNATLEGNSFTLTNYSYVFDGVDIYQGIFNFTEINNTITGAKMLNPKYINNQFFNIIHPSIATTINISAFPGTIPNDGITTSTITATILDQNNQALSGMVVNFTITAGSAALSAASATTGDNGEAVVSLLSSTAGGATVTAAEVSTGIANNITVTIAAPTTITVTANPTTVQVSNPMIISANLKDQNDHGMANEQISWNFTTESGESCAIISITDANGNAVVTLNPTVIRTNIV